MNLCVDQLQEYETQQYSSRETTIMTVDHLHLIKIILLQQEPGGQEDSPCHVLLPPPSSSQPDLSEIVSSCHCLCVPRDQARVWKGKINKNVFSALNEQIQTKSLLSS